MFSSLRRFLFWFTRKLVLGIFIVVSGLTLGGSWLVNRDDVDFSQVHSNWVVELDQRRSELETEMDEAIRNATALQTEIDGARARVARIDSITEAVKSTRTVWRRVFGDREQNRINARRLDELAQMRAEAESRAQKAERELRSTQRQLRRSTRALDSVESQLRLADATDSPVVYYVNAAWRHYAYWIMGALALYWFGPSLAALCLFYFLAPRIARGRPVQLSSSVTAYPWLGESRTLVETALWPGDEARVKPRFLQTGDSDAAKQGRFFLSWRFPLTSVLAGFGRVFQLRNGKAGVQYRLAFADSKNPARELAVVHVPEGGSLIVRPSHLAGVIFPFHEKLRMRRRWQLFRWQAWVTAQFRYFEFQGPCRLIVLGHPGLRAERLLSTDSGKEPSHRTTQDAIIGFTPNLEFRLVRTPRFWNYYSRNHWLFDAYFVGSGFVLTDLSMPRRRPRGLRRRVSRLSDRCLKVFGL